MSTFRVPIVKIREIIPIAGADKIELASVLGYQSVVQKGKFKVGDYAAYIPEGSMVPEWLLTNMGLLGKLAGAEKNRVKIAKLLGVVSQGLLYPVIYGESLHCHSYDLEVEDRPYGRHALVHEIIQIPEENDEAARTFSEPLPEIEGVDVAKMLGITKYEVPIPESMAGEVCNLHGHTLKFDIENIQNYPDVIQNDELVRFTEKCHGTFCAIALDRTLDNSELLFGNMFAYSKGLGSQGLVFKNVANNTHNIYHSTLMKQQHRLKALSWYFDNTVHILGEVFGPGVQDLTYGLSSKTFRVFDIYVGRPGQGRYLNPAELEELVKQFDFELVPELYRGPFNQEVLLQHRDGLETFNQSHMREGVVIRLETGRPHNSIGRVILKSVSPAYLLRKNKNATEFN